MCDCDHGRPPRECELLTHTRIHTRSVKVTRMYAGPVSRVSSYKHWLLNSHVMSSQVKSTPLLASGAHSIGFRMNLSVVSVTDLT
jgi:hypothetical protein